MEIAHRIKGKYFAAKGLYFLMRYFENWQELWPEYRAGKPLRELKIRNGLKVSCGEGDAPLFLLKEIFIEDCYLRDFYVPNPGDVVFDVGANIGFFSLNIGKYYPGVRVHSFEPVADTFKFLKKNVEQNNFSDFIQCYPVGFLDKTEKLIIKKSGISLYQTVAAHSGENTEEIECVTLGKAIELSGVDRIDLLKVDIESAEMEMIKGATDAD